MDLQMPDMDGIEATRRIQETSPTPIVALTAYDAPELVGKASKAGVGAYLLKPPNGKELERAMTIALARFDDMVELRRLNKELQDALDQVQTLSGLLPICSSCKKIRDEEDHWQPLEIYIRDRSEAEFTHSICPDCAKKLYPDYYKPEMSD
jgi:CheY-like chemotaxis protein